MELATRFNCFTMFIHLSPLFHLPIDEPPNDFRLAQQVFRCRDVALHHCFGSSLTRMLARLRPTNPNCLARPTRAGMLVEAGEGFLSNSCSNLLSLAAFVRGFCGRGSAIKAPPADRKKQPPSKIAPKMPPASAPVRMRLRVCGTRPSVSIPPSASTWRARRSVHMEQR